MKNQLMPLVMAMVLDAWAIVWYTSLAISAQRPGCKDMLVLCDGSTQVSPRFCAFAVCGQEPTAPSGLESEA